MAEIEAAARHPERKPDKKFDEAGRREGEEASSENIIVFSSMRPSPFCLARQLF